MLNLTLIFLTSQIQWCHLWCPLQHVMPVQVPDASHELNHVAPHINHLDQRNAVVPFTMLSASCDADTGANGITWPKCHVAPHFDHLYLRKGMVPLLMPLASHGYKCLVAPMFDHLDLGNVLVTFIMWSISYDTDIGVTDVTWPKVMLHLILIILTQKCSGTTHDTIGVIQYWHWCQWHHMTKNSCHISLWLSWPMECNSTIYNAISIMWCQCQRCHMTRSHVAPHFNCLDLRNAMVALMTPLASCDADTDAKANDITGHDCWHQCGT